VLRIKRLTLVLECDNITHNTHKNVLSEFIKNKLNHILQNTLNINIQLSQTKEIIVDKVEINLGTLELNNDFIDNFKIQLQHHFQDIITEKINFDYYYNEEYVLRQCYDKVTEFLCHGIIENNDTIADIQNYYSYLLTSKQDIYNYSIKDFIITILSNVSSRERFILHFDNSIIEKTIMLLFKNEYIVCVNMLKQLCETLKSIHTEKNNISAEDILEHYYKNNDVITDTKEEIQYLGIKKVKNNNNNLELQHATTKTYKPKTRNIATDKTISHLIHNKHLLRNVYLFLLEYYEQFGGIGDENIFLKKMIYFFTRHEKTNNKTLLLLDNSVNDKITSPDNNEITFPDSDKITSPDNDKITSPDNDEITFHDNDKITFPDNDKITFPDNDNTTTLEIEKYNQNDDILNSKKGDGAIINTICQDLTIDDFRMLFSYLYLVAKDTTSGSYNIDKNVGITPQGILLYISLRNLASQLQNTKIQYNEKDIDNVIDKINSCLHYLFTDIKIKTITITSANSQEDLSVILHNICSYLEDKYPMLKDYNSATLRDYNSNSLEKIPKHNIPNSNSHEDNTHIDDNILKYPLSSLYNFTDVKLLFFFIHCVNNYESKDIYDIIKDNIISQIGKDIYTSQIKTYTSLFSQHDITQTKPLQPTSPILQQSQLLQSKTTMLQHNNISDDVIIKFYSACYLLSLAKEYEYKKDKDVILEKGVMLYCNDKRNLMQDTVIAKIISTDKDLQATFTEIILKLLFHQNSKQEEYILLLEKEDFNIGVDMIIDTLHHCNAEQIISFLQNANKCLKTRLYEKIYNYAVEHGNKNITSFFDNIFKMINDNNNVHNTSERNIDINMIKNIVTFYFLCSDAQYRYSHKPMFYQMQDNITMQPHLSHDTTKHIYSTLIDILCLDKKYFNGYIKNIFLQHFCINAPSYNNIIIDDNIYNNKNVALNFYVRYLLVLCDHISQNTIEKASYEMITSKLKLLEDNIFRLYNLYRANNKITSIHPHQNTIDDIIQQNIICDVTKQNIIGNVTQQNIDQESKSKIYDDDDDTEIESYELIKKTYILNGGLVFLSPFFNVLFSKLGFLHPETGLFKSFLFQSNAVHTLQYIINKRYSNPEWRLLLNKILCGMDYNANIYSSFVFNEDTKIQKQEMLKLKQQCKEVILTCIDTWKELEVLKSYKEFKNGVNVTNFTKYFLARDAMLHVFKVHYKRKTLYKYVIDISSRCYDEDIKTMPWDISTLFFPWSQNVIKVHNVIIHYEKK